MIGKRKHYFFIIAMLLLVIDATAGQRYWVGTGANKNWNGSGNWVNQYNILSATPGASDSVYFDSHGSGQCSLNLNVSIKMFSMSSAYTDTVKQNAFGFTVGTSGMIISGGTFWGGALATISNAGIFTLSGGYFRSTSGRLAITKDYTHTGGTFNPNGGEVFFTGIFNIKGSTDFYDCTFYPQSGVGGTYGLDTASTFNVLHKFTSTGAILNDGKIYVQGDLYQNGGNPGTNSSTAIIVINGTSTQTFYGQPAIRNSHGAFRTVQVNKSSGTLYLKDTVVITGTWQRIAGTIDDTTYNSTLSFPASGTGNYIKGKQRIQNIFLTTYGGTANTLNINTGDTVTVGGVIEIAGNAAVSFTGIINLTGNLKVTSTTNVVTASGGAGTLWIHGAGTQTITGAATIGPGHLCNVKIDKPTGTLKLKKYVSAGGNWQYVQGGIDAYSDTATVVFGYSTGRTISGQHTLYNVLFDGTNPSTNTINATDTLTTTGTVTISGAGTVLINTGVVRANGNVLVSNTGTLTGGTYTLFLSGGSNQIFTGNATILAGPVGYVKIKKSGGTLTLRNYITVSKDWSYLGGAVFPDTAAATASTVVFPFTPSGSRSISGYNGNMLFYNVNFNGNNATYPSTNNIVSTDTMIVKGELQYGGAAGIVINTGTVSAKGKITLGNSYTGTNAGTGYINICGAGPQTLMGNNVAGSCRLCNVNVNKPSGTLTLVNTISIGIANWTFISGGVNPGTSTFVYSGSGTFNCGTNPSMSLYNFRVQIGTITLASGLDVKNDFTIDMTRTLTAGAYTIKVGRNWDNQGTFTYGTGKIMFTGSGSQYFIHPTSAQTFYNLEINKPSGKVYLSSGSVTVNRQLTLTKGIIVSSGSKYLNLIDTATVSGGSDSAYVSGLVKKSGNYAFKYPLGDTTLTSGAYHPLAITAPASGTNAFIAQYHASGQTYGSTLQTDSLQSISDCEYWLLTRTTGTAVVIPTISWNSNSCNVDSYSDLRAAYWDTTGTPQWKSLGFGGTAVAGSLGALHAAFGISAVRLPIVIALPYFVNRNPYASLKRQLDAGYSIVKNGTLRFKFDEEYNDVDNKLTFKIYDDAHHAVVVNSTALLPALQKASDYGEEWYSINVLNCGISSSGYLAAGYYILEVQNEKNEKWYLRFRNDLPALTITCPR